MVVKPKDKPKHIPLLHQEITGKILDAYANVFALYRTRPGYSEKNFSEAMLIELGALGLSVATNTRVPRLYKDRVIGWNEIDLLVDDKVGVELKKAERLTAADEAQLMTYLRDRGLAVGLVLKFGGTTPEFKRVFEPRNAPPRARRGEDES